MNNPPTQLKSLDSLQAFLAEKQYSKHFILTDSNTQVHCLPILVGAVDLLAKAEVLEVEPGEQSKNADVLNSLWEALIELGADRHSCIINLGGGMVSDLGGFLASTFKRGIDCIHIPTSLLAMVDAAIGGKNGINVGPFKNQAGNITNPVALVQAVHWLETLPERQLLSGFAEMVKHALIFGGDHCDDLLSIKKVTPKTLVPFISTSQEIKSGIVAKDPFERGIRKILNFGHTTGHALESVTLNKGKNALLHGEAIALGMRVALKLSLDQVALNRQIYEVADQFIRRHFPIDLPYNNNVLAGELWKIMQADKKNAGNQVRFILLKHPGEALQDQSITFEAFQSALGVLDN